MELPVEFKRLFGEDILSGPYKGKLSIPEAVIIINKIIANSIELCRDAQLLFDNNRFARCLSLSNLALEEMGKIHIIMDVLRSPDQKSLNGCWNSFLNHREKNYTWLFPLLNEMRDEVSNDHFIKITDPKGDMSLIPHQLKMKGFYVGVNSKREPIDPNNDIRKDMAGYFLDTAIIVATEDIIWRTEECLQVWADYHVAPHNGKDEIRMYNELAEKNLITKIRAEKIIANIGLKQSPKK